MTKPIRHVLGISGGKDSAALAIYMKKKYPSLDIEYYTCDTGKELDETYDLIINLQTVLGKPIKKLITKGGSSKDPFDHWYNIYKGYLPSTSSRWCTKNLKIDPFEEFVGNDQVISYVGIRGDEEREGYISRKSNIQSIFPFRKNIWSEDVISKVLKNENIKSIEEIYNFSSKSLNIDRIIQIVNQPISTRFTMQQKLNLLLDQDIKEFNKVVFEYLKVTEYPLSRESYFPIVDNDDILVREDIFKILRESGVGVPAYYEPIKFEIDGQEGQYMRSRSGCYFCFFQQKIEWVWLLEQHPDLFEKAKYYENQKDGFTWNQGESLVELSEPTRVENIKRDFLNRHKNKPKSSLLLDILDDSESEGCASCFV